MKNLFIKSLSLAALAALFASCAKETQEPGNNAPIVNDGPTGTIGFHFKTEGIQDAGISRTVPYEYAKDNFRILAFKKQDNGNDYVFLKEVPLDGMSYKNSTLDGTAELPIGEYKFVPTYNLKNPAGYTFPEMTGQPLSESLAITHTAGSLPAVYAESRQYADLPSYVLGTTSSPNQTVSSNMTRSVSRIDVLFVNADKDETTGKYTPKAGDHIFGGQLPASVKMKLTGLNPSLSLTGRCLTEGATPFDTQYLVPDLANYITIGTGEAMEVGTDQFKDYDNVLPENIISGSAHMHGAYVIPNEDETGTVGLELEITPKSGTSRTITIPVKLPVQRNKVTLVTVYVRTGNVFTTNVDYNVTVDTVWDGTHHAETEIN